MKRRIVRILGLVFAFALFCTPVSAETDYWSLCELHDVSSPDLIAWIEIPEASICEPVMCHPKDDTFYAKHAANGSEAETGSLYVQKHYNASGFSDPVTLIYGSHADPAPFSTLQETFSGRFDQCKTIYIHLPGETMKYEAFAALPYSSIHILHYYDFRIEKRYNDFFDSVFSTRVLGMHLNHENRPEFEKERVIILSTGLRGDSLQRYLVMAREADP